MVFLLALKNLRRHLRRTILTLAAIGLGTALALFSIGLGDGAHLQMIENGVRIGHGHLTLQQEGYLESPSISLLVPDPSSAIQTFLSSGFARGVYPRVRGEGILATAAGGEGVQFQGIDPGLPGEAEIFRKSMEEGAFLDSPGENSILIGRKLAEKLKVKVGSKTVLTTQDANGEIISTLLRVKGIFRSGSTSIDGGICLIPLETLQEALQMGAGVTSIAVYLENPFQQKRALDEMGRILPEGQGKLYPWQSLQPDLRDYVIIDDAFAYILYAIILLIVAIGVLNTVLMSVMERRREIGILTALGMGGGSIMGMVLVETVLITLLGIFFGVLLGLGVNWYFTVHGLDLSSFYQEEFTLAGTILDPVMHSHLRVNRALGVCLAVFLITVTMGVYPAWKASRTRPVEAMEKP